MKPVLRWTIGDVSNIGFQIFEESIKTVLKFYENNFDYYVCYNCDEKKIITFKDKFLDVNFVKQKWEPPIPITQSDNINKTLDFFSPVINSSLWKISPARISPKTHEIILDNDLIFLKRPKTIDAFLKQSDKNLIVEDCIRYFGKYDHLIHPSNAPGYNSGIIGLVPNYDLGAEIFKTWMFKKEYNFTYGSEQGLIMGTLLKNKCIVGQRGEFLIFSKNEIFRSQIPYWYCKIKNITDNSVVDYGNDLLNVVFEQASVAHFATANRNLFHIAWDFYVNQYKKKFFI